MLVVPVYTPASAYLDAARGVEQVVAYVTPSGLHRHEPPAREADFANLRRKAVRFDCAYCGPGSAPVSKRLVKIMT